MTEPALLLVTDGGTLLLVPLPAPDPPSLTAGLSAQRRLLPQTVTFPAPFAAAEIAGAAFCPAAALLVASTTDGDLLWVRRRG